MRKFVCAATAAITLTIPIPAAFAAPSPILSGDALTSPSRTQISFDNTITGFHTGTANEHESRPALSLIKLYIAEYVVNHGDPGEIPTAQEMIRNSDDNLASQFYSKYPQSVSVTATEFGLNETHAASHWGNSTTSSYDVNKYLVAKRQTDPNSPVLLAMTQMNPVAADGYHQDYGTATLPGVQGSKLGWSDDRSSVHASASFGPGFVVSANTYGTAEQHTQDVQQAFTTTPEMQDADSIATGNASELLPEMPNLLDEFIRVFLPQPMPANN
ncbi:MAG: hypothetical protein Q3976_04410 [Corynebacterium sp.]|nr:hypothetical protein [Corynebacterium sp.]